MPLACEDPCYPWQHACLRCGWRQCWARSIWRRIVWTVGPSYGTFLAGNQVSRSGVVMPYFWEWPNLCFCSRISVSHTVGELLANGNRKWLTRWLTRLLHSRTMRAYTTCSFPFFPPRFAMKTLKTTSSLTSVWAATRFLSPKRTFAQQRNLGGVTVRVHERWSTPWHLCWYRRWLPVPSCSPSSPCSGGVWLNKHGQSTAKSFVFSFADDVLKLLDGSFRVLVPQ